METSNIYSHLCKHHIIELITQSPSLNKNLNEKLKFKKIIKELKITPTPLDISLLEALESRSSVRQLGPINFEALGTILYYSARVKDTHYNEDNYLKSFRPYCSAGARHSLELFCLTSKTTGMEDGMWYFDPFQLKLILIEIPSSYIESMYKKTEKLLDGNSPNVIILSLSILERTLSRYKNGLSLIWRDTGNLFATMALVCEGLQLKTCQLGLSEKFQYAEEVNHSMNSVWITGAMAIGSIKNNTEF